MEESRNPEDMEDVLDLQGTVAVVVSERANEEGDGTFLHPPLPMNGRKKRTRDDEGEGEGEQQPKSKKHMGSQQDAVYWSCCQCGTLNQGVIGGTCCTECPHEKCGFCTD